MFQYLRLIQKLRLVLDGSKWSFVNSEIITQDSFNNCRQKIKQIIVQENLVSNLILKRSRSSLKSR